MIGGIVRDAVGVRGGGVAEGDGDTRGLGGISQMTGERAGVDEICGGGGGSKISGVRAGVAERGGGAGSQIGGTQQLVTVAPPEITIRVRIAF
ncbi:MAG: hypothetical protein HZB51_16175 [Chloroflexi bacterium]|nr:hypothetical protein [Chloroflexota bacterium]